MTGRLRRRLAWPVLAALLLLGAATQTVFADDVRVGSEAEVTSEGGANLRSDPSTDAAVVSLVGEARYVFVKDGPKDGWYQVEYDGEVGWVHGGLLGPARARGTSRGDAAGRSDERPRSTAPEGVSVGREAQVSTDGGVNLRKGPSTDEPVVELVRNARLVYVLDGPRVSDDGPWFKVDFDGTVGWVLGSFLGARGSQPIQTVAERARTAPAAAPARKAEAAPAAPAAPPASSSRGETIAARAMQMLGVPYAWGGTSPRYGFDCSGLVAFAYGAVGAYPGRTSYEQAGAGRSVSGGQLLPGDIVVFANTFGGGYSHSGIYVGGGRFVHSQDENTGVVVSSLYGGYWGAHYAGARRAW